jgi:HrpA-like RNA helicase
MFFHELCNEEEVVNSFPLYFITIDIIKRTNEIEINFPNKLIFINTPAINHFEYENVLATARATAISSALKTLNSVEVFLQTQYQCSEPFILEINFRDIISEGDKYPKIRSRMGIQTVSREDGQFLDYSEIIVDTETSKKNVFSELVGKYINGEVESNQDSVDKEYRETYPINSFNRYVSDNPLPLNSSQKRILLALKNERNKIVVVDGPPGTGKSHTIAAISY